MRRTTIAYMVLVAFALGGIGTLLVPHLMGNKTGAIIAATVTSLKAENKLVVYSYSGDTRVSVATDGHLFGLVQGEQELIVPATVSYYLDMAELSADQVKYGEQSHVVKVALPALKIGDVAFQPERAKAINGGVLTYSDKIVQNLQKANYTLARQAFAAQARQKALIELAEAQAVKNVQSYFEIPLRAVGDNTTKIHASFR